MGMCGVLVVFLMEVLGGIEVDWLLFVLLFFCYFMGWLVVKVFVV